MGITRAVFNRSGKISFFTDALKRLDRTMERIGEILFIRKDGILSAREFFVLKL